MYKYKIIYTVRLLNVLTELFHFKRLIVVVLLQYRNKYTVSNHSLETLSPQLQH